MKCKKVKELVEELLKLDQEKNIWVLYDGFDAQVPEFITVTKDKARDEMEAGDYMYETW